MALYPKGPIPQGRATALGITTPTIIQVGPGIVVNVIEIVDGTTPGAIYDSASLSGNSTLNQICVIPSSGNTTELLGIGMPCIHGIVVVPGTGKTLAISYS